MIVLDTSIIIDYFRGVETTYNLIDEESEIAVTTINCSQIIRGDTFQLQAPLSC
ncbi:conserved hypothetical protein [Archaeoglobus fulgidus DSM 4304]|uniref:Uncharacterized protein AF_1480 n=1 Tax=Archaeoglobus fulgidus (strain ATCC 49558 / DSM 4304 / JCM 9628 / NBRC 100126 / VC-16) TaxID=224325 RepID=Y1480_ARCFU|nr:RecName: Full=Uncharacterized protein AF_1480 [Archaeoglobus fulgidus DSM 4304]AAB89767.1 conserved hypothetical protein [Archaeoglobus fulgidus DSM 4304]